MSSRLGILCNTMEYPLEICLSYVFVIVFFSCSEVSGRVSGKVSVLDVFLALVSQVLSFYSLHISLFSPVISRDQCPQREQQTFPQDWEDYAILWSILWRYVCHTCLSLFFFSCSEVSGKVSGKVSVLDDCCSFFFFQKTFCMFFNVFHSFKLLFSSYVPEKSPEKFPEKSPENSPEKYPEIFLPGISKFVCENLQVAERYPDGI